jgi:Fe-S-cluster containining protein
MDPMDRSKPPEDPARQVLAELERQLDRGLLHTHTQSSAHVEQLLRLASTTYALIDLLVERGFLSIEEVQAQMAIVEERLRQSEFARGLQVVLAQDTRDKYDPAVAVTIDCAERLPLCKAACCSLAAPLSPQDVSEGIVRWDAGRPYLLRRDREGRCCHWDRGGGSCSVYEQRPLGCRTYSCAGDVRIWKDFEQRAPNPEGIAALLGQRDEPMLHSVGLPAESSPRQGRTSPPDPADETSPE